MGWSILEKLWQETGLLIFLVYCWKSHGGAPLYLNLGRYLGRGVLGAPNTGLGE